MTHKDAISLITEEFYKAYRTHSPFHSKHEGYAVLKEEVDELWDAIKANDDDYWIAKEAAQVGAMVICFLVFCCQERTDDD